MFGLNSRKGTRKIRHFPWTFQTLVTRVPSLLGIRRVRMITFGLTPSTSNPASVVSSCSCFSKLFAWSGHTLPVHQYQDAQNSLLPKPTVGERTIRNTIGMREMNASRVWGSGSQSVHRESPGFPALERRCCPNQAQSP